MLRNKSTGLFQIASFVLFGFFIASSWGENLQTEEKMQCYIVGDMLCLPILPRRTDYNKDELLLLLDKNVPESLYKSLLIKYGLDEISETRLDSLSVDLKIANTNGQDPLDLSKKINRIYEDIEAATNNIYKLEINDTKLLDKDDYPKSLTGAHRALQYSRGEGVLIGMIDGPVDSLHSSLRNRVQQVNLVNTVNRSVAKLAHGTAIAGVIISNNPQIGIAPSARLFSVVAFERKEHKGKVAFSSSSALIAQAIDLAIKRKVDILNLSFSGGKDAVVRKLVDKAIKAGIIVVASCGNDASTKPRYPAAIPGVIAVTAVDHLKRPYARANKGKHIDVAAPGVGVLTTGPGERYQLSSGTSLAAANVSGSLALLLAKKKNIDKDVLSLTATDLGAPGRDALFGDGLINVLSALKSIIR